MKWSVSLLQFTRVFSLTSLSLSSLGGMQSNHQARSLAFPHLARAFYDSIISFGPNDFFVMQKGIKEDAQRPTLKSIVALLKPTISAPL